MYTSITGLKTLSYGSCSLPRTPTRQCWPSNRKVEQACNVTRALFWGGKGEGNRVNFYNQQTQNNQSRLWKFGGCKGAMLKRLKKEIVILFNIFLGLHLCTSEFSQSTFGCSRVCERRVCRRFLSCGSGPPWYWYCWGPGLRQKFVLWQMALDLGPPRLPKKTEKCVCHMGKI